MSATCQALFLSLSSTAPEDRNSRCPQRSAHILIGVVMGNDSRIVNDLYERKHVGRTEYFSWYWNDRKLWKERSLRMASLSTCGPKEGICGLPTVRWQDRVYAEGEVGELDFSGSCQK